MFDALLKAIRGHPVPEPALRPALARPIDVPELDRIEPAPPPGPVEPEYEPPLANRAFVICYVDASGSPSERRIICHQVYEAEGVAYLRARCLERQASRTFRVDRVREIYCGVTGEDLGPPTDVLIPTGPKRDARPRPSAAYRAAQRALQLLVTVARSDGEYHPEEARLIERFIGAALAGPQYRADRASLSDYSHRLAPSLSGFRETFELLLRYDRQILPLLFETLGPLMEADGVTSKAEVDLMVELVLIAKSHGVHIDIVDA